MEIQITSQDKKRIEESIRAKYAKVARSPEGLFKHPTGLAGLRALKYDSKITQTLPEAVADSYCGGGNPFLLGPVAEGEAALHIGCGAGVVMGGRIKLSSWNTNIKGSRVARFRAYNRIFAVKKSGLRQESSGPFDSA